MCSGVAEERFRHPEGQPSRLVHHIQQEVQDEQAQGQLDQDVLHPFSGRGAEDEVRRAVEEGVGGIGHQGRAEHQMDQAASACSSNIDNPPNVLAPSAEAVLNSPVSVGL